MSPPKHRYSSIFDRFPTTNRTFIRMAEHTITGCRVLAAKRRCLAAPNTSCTTQTRVRTSIQPRQPIQSARGHDTKQWVPYDRFACLLKRDGIGSCLWSIAEAFACVVGDRTGSAGGHARVAVRGGIVCTRVELEPVACARIAYDRPAWSYRRYLNLVCGNLVCGHEGYHCISLRYLTLVVIANWFD